MLSYYRSRLDETFPDRYVIFGHIGDAHVHINLFSDPADPQSATELLPDLALKSASNSAARFRRSTAWESARRICCKLQFSEDQLDAMRAVKWRPSIRTASWAEVRLWGSEPSLAGDRDRRHHYQARSSGDPGGAAQHAGRNCHSLSGEGRGATGCRLDRPGFRACAIPGRRGLRRYAGLPACAANYRRAARRQTRSLREADGAEPCGCRSMQRAARIVRPHFRNRLLPPAVSEAGRARQLIEAGAIGRPVFAEATAHDWFVPTGRPRAGCGSGALRRRPACGTSRRTAST